MESLPIITEEILATVRRELLSEIGDYRFRHTLGVERAATTLGELCLPSAVSALRLAALLHDATKEWSYEKQVAYLQENGIALSPSDMASPKILHAKSAAIFAKKRYPAYVNEAVLRAIAFHTTGNPQMTLFDEIIFLADLVEEGRTYPLSLEVRQFLFSALEKEHSPEKHAFCLRQAMLLALRGTIAHLLEEACPIAEDTLATYNTLLLQK